MRRWLWFLCLAAVLAPGGAVAADEPGDGEPGPSLEYRPPRKVLPEPRQLTPAPPITLFRETIGSFGISEGYFDRPVDAAFDREGWTYVLDAGNNRVQVFDENRKFLFTWGSFGSRPAEFNDPSAIALDESGFVYVVDTGNHRIQKFSVDKPGRSAQHVASLGGLGSGSGKFKSPKDLTFDSSGELWVLDAGNDRVQRFDASLAFVSEWGRFFGSRGGAFAGLESIAWSDERFGYVYLLSAGCLVQQFEPDGSFVRSWSAAAPDSGLCVPARLETDNRNRYLYVLDAGNGLLMRFNRDGQFLAALRGAERTFSKPGGFTLSADGNEVAVADTGGNVVQRFTLR